MTIKERITDIEKTQLNLLKDVIEKTINKQLKWEQYGRHQAEAIYEEYEFVVDSLFKQFCYSVDDEDYFIMETEDIKEKVQKLIWVIKEQLGENRDNIQ